MSDRNSFIKRYENARQEMREILNLAQRNAIVYAPCA
jgi:hypothetical protein